MESESDKSLIKEENGINSLASKLSTLEAGKQAEDLAQLEGEQQTSDEQSLDHQQAGEKQISGQIETSTIAAAGRVDSSKQRLSAKSSNYQRSLSSPSTLTTHRFGLRPTPSPPRLIIDHQTGDIVESYPEQPVYLRTYQPLDDDDELSSEQVLDDDSLAHPNPPPLSNRRQLEQYKELLAEQYGQLADLLGAFNGNQASEQQQQQLPAVEIMSNRQYSPYRPAIPPPHSGQAGKVYFAPPMPSAGHLFHHDSYEEPLEQQAPTVRASTSGGNNDSFKRALNKLNEAKTDIALLIEPEGGLSGNSGQQQVRITATSAERAYSLLAQQQHGRGSTTQATNSNRQQISSSKANKNKQLKQQQAANKSSINDFSLYNFCFIFHILSVILVSSFIIYLFVVLLHVECVSHRTEHTYISIIVASVNLICVSIFTIIWYCNGVTRTFYANSSSSAFIISIYLILVAVNLALAIFFFLSNTCHAQKLHTSNRDFHKLKAPLSLGQQQYQYQRGDNQHLASARETALPDGFPVDLLQLKQSHQQEHSNKDTESVVIVTKRQIDDTSNDDLSSIPNPTDGGGKLGTASSEKQLHEAELLLQEQEQDHQQPASLTMSPMEAIWEMTKEQLFSAKRKFYLFLARYDLNFVGALHLVCANCLFYLAMRVAVIRSHFCSPVGAYA